jgi:hypothetical protein
VTCSVRHVSDETNTTFKRIETFGAFTLDLKTGLVNPSAKLLNGGRVIKGFVRPQNKSPAIPLLANSVVT